MTTTCTHPDPTACEHTPALPPLSALSETDRALLTRYATCNSLLALAFETNSDPINLILWADSPHIAPWLARLSAERATHRTQLALATLESILTTSTNPKEKRLAATALLKPPRPSRAVGASPRKQPRAGDRSQLPARATEHSATAAHTPQRDHPSASPHAAPLRTSIPAVPAVGSTLATGSARPSNSHPAPRPALSSLCASGPNTGSITTAAHPAEASARPPTAAARANPAPPTPPAPLLSRCAPPTRAARLISLAGAARPPPTNTPGPASPPQTQELLPPRPAAA